MTGHDVECGADEALQHFEVGASPLREPAAQRASCRAPEGPQSGVSSPAPEAPPARAVTSPAGMT